MRRETPQQAAPNSWLNYVIVALCAGAVGTGLAWFLLERPVSTPAPAPKVAVLPGSAPSDSAPPFGVPPFAGNNAGAANLSSPPAQLTAGLPPPQAAVALANWHYDHEQWTQAIAHYRQALAQGVDNPDVRTDLGNAYRFAGQPKQALSQYLEAQRQDSEHENSLFNQGGLYAFSLHDPAKGIVIWRTYLKRFPQGRNVSEARRLIAQASKGKR